MPRRASSHPDDVRPRARAASRTPLGAAAEHGIGDPARRGKDEEEGEHGSDRPQLEFWNENGYLAIEGVLPPHEVEELRRALDRLTITPRGSRRARTASSCRHSLTPVETTPAERRSCSKSLNRMS